jgi:hypothetical protein
MFDTEIIVVLVVVLQTQMVIRMPASPEKGHSKAMKIAAETQGVESVTLAGKDRNLLLLVGDGVDCNGLTTKLRKKVGHADVVELRTLHDAGAGGYYYAHRAGGGLARDDVEYGNRYGYPVAAYDYYYRYSYNHSPYAGTVVQATRTAAPSCSLLFAL